MDGLDPAGSPWSSWMGLIQLNGLLLPIYILPWVKQIIVCIFLASNHYLNPAICPMLFINVLGLTFDVWKLSASLPPARHVPSGFICPPALSYSETFCRPLSIVLAPKYIGRFQSPDSRNRPSDPSTHFVSQHLFDVPRYLTFSFLYLAKYSPKIDNSSKWIEEATHWFGIKRNPLIVDICATIHLHASIHSASC